MLVSQRVHALPEAFVLERRQLTIFGDTAESICFQTLHVIRQVLKDFGFEDKEPAIDPAFTRDGLFRKALNHPVIDRQSAESSRGANRRDCGDFSLFAVKF